jgi:hypothetical protein
MFQGVKQQKQEHFDPIKKSSSELFSSVPPTVASPPPSPAKKQGPRIEERFQIPYVSTPNPKPRPLFFHSLPSTSSDESVSGRTIRKKMIGRTIRKQMIEPLFDSDSDSSEDSSSNIKKDILLKPFSEGELMFKKNNNSSDIYKNMKTFISNSYVY